VSLQRLVLTFTQEGVEIRTLYRRKDGPNPGTKARLREVTELAGAGLTQALEAPRQRSWRRVCRYVGIHHKGGCPFGCGLK
jgi:hypothetical protein